MNNTWFALPTEIMNKQKICNIEIDHKMSNLFCSMPELCILHKLVSSIETYDVLYSYPLPDAVYTGSHFKQVEFNSAFLSVLMIAILKEYYACTVQTVARAHAHLESRLRPCNSRAARQWHGDAVKKGKRKSERKRGKKKRHLSVQTLVASLFKATSLETATSWQKVCYGARSCILAGCGLRRRHVPSDPAGNAGDWTKGHQPF
jgi:hypothetical protein